MKTNSLVIAALTSATLMFTMCTPSVMEEVKEEAVKPNFLFILVDDLGYNDIGIMGSDYYETPHIDAIGQQGMVFTDGYATCAVCSPSRASLLTGKYTAKHGITDWIGAKTGQEWKATKRYTKLLPPDYNHTLPFEDITIPEALKEGGYNTFFAGKWHLGSAEDKSLPTDHGFDINKGGYHMGGPYSGGFFSPFNNPYLTDTEDERGMSLSMKLAKETSAFISEQGDAPFLAYLSFYAVHAPIQTSRDKWSKYREKAASMGLAEKGFEMERILPIRQAQDNPVYAGLIEQVDEAVGKVIQTLKESGLDENTVVIFTSDNGGVASGDNYSTSLSPLRGGKGYQWEGGIRVPYLVYVPWADNNGTKNNTPVTGADFYPTIMDLAGIEMPADIDGVSLTPLLEDDEITPRPLYWHYPHYGNQGGEPHSAIRVGDLKLIHYWEDGRDELYDLSLDLGERADIASDHPDRVVDMSQTLMDWLVTADAKFPAVDPTFDPDSLELKLEYYRTVLLTRLEKERTAMLSEDWQPNANWWGSEVMD